MKILQQDTLGSGLTVALAIAILFFQKDKKKNNKISLDVRMPLIASYWALLAK